MRITNEANICLPLAVWLLHDEYDYIDKPNYISVTTLMKPLKQFVLAHRIPPAERTADVEDFIASTLGTAIHDSIEKSWVVGYQKSMKMLGYPQDLIDRIRINPEDEELRGSNSIIPIYLEQRGFRALTVKGVAYTIGGKFDMVADGIVQDNKSTTCYTWTHATRDDQHTLQLSLYRWIDACRSIPRIKEDFGQINYVFTDWSKASARQQPAYPQRRVEQKELPLLSLKETEEYVFGKLIEIQKYLKSPEESMPRCSDEELWRSSPQYKYYADITKAAVPGSRSTKNFDDMVEARKFMAEKGGKGVIVTKPGEVKACNYCAAYDVCQQRREYFPD